MNNLIHKEVGSVVKTVEGVEKSLGHMIAPLRHSAFRRFPTLFALLTTFGFAATILGMEHILTSIPILHNHPWLILAVGVGILVLTGRLHKKLD